MRTAPRSWASYMESDIENALHSALVTCRKSEAHSTPNNFIITDDCHEYSSLALDTYEPAEADAFRHPKRRDDVLWWLGFEMDPAHSNNLIRGVC